MSTALKADLKRNYVRFPRVLSLRSVFDYLKRAYPAEPQPGKRITEALTFLEDRGFWFVGKGDGGLECRGCGMAYVRSGNASNHRCSSASLGATSFERAKSQREALEGPAISERMSWDLPEVETSFEHVTEAPDGQRSSVNVHSSLGQPLAPEREPICVPLQLHRDRS